MRRLTAAGAKALVCLIVCLHLAGAAWAGSSGATVSSSATVQIIRPAGVVGLQELSNAQGFLTPTEQATDPAVIRGLPLVRSGPVTAPSTGGTLAGAIAISGEPNQAFSLTLTDSLVVVTDTGELLVTNFDHNAGANPMIGGDGAAEIAIGAKSHAGGADALQQLSTNAGTPDGEAQSDPNVVAVLVQTPKGPRIVKIRRPDNFGPTIFGEKFFTVLVSYN
tara:strand:- start:641 stop:1303 length:663 start_codon:yes stop_codon:yes gene_type:complete